MSSDGPHSSEIRDVAEMDFAYSWVKEAVDALDSALRRAMDDWANFDGLTALDYVEHIAGLAFVAVQQYLSSSASQFGKSFRDTPPIDDLFSRYGNVVPALSVTNMEAVWAIANYWKHHEDWPDWTTPGRHRRTVETLEQLGVSQHTEFPVVRVAEILCGNEFRLSDLLVQAEGWRERCVDALVPKAGQETR